MASPYRRRELRQARDVLTIATSAALLGSYARLSSPVRLPSVLRSVALDPLGDLRRYDPRRDLRPAFATVRKAARISERPSRSSLLMAPGRFGFADPRKVMICVRRKERRQVLFAKGVGGSRVRRGRRNAWSYVFC